MAFYPNFNKINITTPEVVDLQFYGTTANMTMKRYFDAFASLVTRGSLDPSLRAFFAGKVIMIFSGMIDRDHCDGFMNDTDTPDWLPTVGYWNISLNVDYITTSGDNQLMRSCSLAMLLLLLQMLVFLS